MYWHEYSRWSRGKVLLAAMLFCLTGAVSAQEDAQGTGAVEANAQANNPLASFTAFNQHNYVIGNLTDTDQAANQYWMRYAQPITTGKLSWIFRASLPFNTFPVAPTLEYETGLGDLNAFAACLIDVGNPKIAFGIGPQITAPTATHSALGSQKWSAGLVNTLFSFASPKFQYGYLVSWQGSFAGDDGRRDVNVGAFQPFLFFQLGGGTYLRSSAVMVYDFDNDTYTYPLGLGIGRVVPFKKTIYNFWLEPQYSMADRGAGWPAWQIFFALNMQFKK